MSTQDNRRARFSTTPSGRLRGGVNAKQPRLLPSPRVQAAASSSPDETSYTSPSEATTATSRRSNSRQANLEPPPSKGSPAGSIVPEQQSHPGSDIPGSNALLLWDPVLQTLADGLDDVEKVRIAQANRYRILTATSEDSDGETRGFGLSVDHPAVAALDAQLKTLEFLDKSMTKALAKQLRHHPLYPMVKGTKGLGDKTVARLLAAVHDPYWNDLHNRPRTVGELFAFCGVAGPGCKRARGIKVNWSPDARKRLWIMTGPIIRTGGPYRVVYDAGREKYADKTHTAPCAQCGVKGTPAAEGTPWRDGHKHAGAIRLVMREILRDLWTEARSYYELQQERAA